MNKQKMKAIFHSEVAGEKKIQLISWGIFFLVFTVLYFFIIKRVWCLINSDMAGEMLMSKQLADENRILTPNWYYANELRFLHVNLIWQLLFEFSDNWYLVRILSSGICYVLLMISTYCLCRRLNLSKWFPLVGVPILLPLSLDYFDFIQIGLYYIPYLIFGFWGFSLAIHFLQADSRKERSMVLVMAVLLAGASCVAGMRVLAMFYFPLFVSALYMAFFDLRQYQYNLSSLRSIRSFRYLLVSGMSFLGGLAGCVFKDTVLARYYTFNPWDKISFKKFDFNMIPYSFGGMMRILGYTESGISIGTILTNAMSFAITVSAILSVIWILKNRVNIPTEYVYMTAFFVLSILIYMGIYIFTDMVYVDVYCIPFLMFVFPVIAIWLKTNKFYGKKNVLIIILTVIVLLGSMANYNELWKEDKTAQRRIMVDVLRANGYQSGYSSFWYSNVLTELSNGELEMYTWGHGTDGSLNKLDNINDMLEWMQSTEHKTKRPEGKVFLLFTPDMLKEFPWKDGLLDDDLIYESTEYKIYGYNSYSDMIDHVSRYCYQFTDGKWIENGEDIDLRRIIHPGGKSYGPYQPVYQGSYLIRIEGENLSALEIQCICHENDDMVTQFEFQMRESSEGKCLIDMEIPEDKDRFELILVNNGSEDSVLDSIEIIRNTER